MCTEIFETCVQSFLRARGVYANPGVFVAKELLKPTEIRFEPFGLGSVFLWSPCDVAVSLSGVVCFDVVKYSFYPSC